MAARQYGIPGFPVVVENGRVRASTRRWRGFGRRAIEGDLSDYIAIGRRIVVRANVMTAYWSPPRYHQLVLMHKADRRRDVALWETDVPIADADETDKTIRLQAETFATEFDLPILDGAKIPAQTRRSDSPASPDVAFGYRLPDEINMSVHDLVSHNRIVVDPIPPTPRGVTVTRGGDAVVIQFRYSPIWEIGGLFGAFIPLALYAVVSHRAAPTHLNFAEFFMPLIVAIPFLLIGIVVGIYLIFQNGSELTLSETKWRFHQAPGLWIFQSYGADSDIDVAHVEAVRRDGRHVMIDTDAHLHRVRCRNRANAYWLQTVLLNVAANGPEALRPRRW